MPVGGTDLFRGPDGVREEPATGAEQLLAPVVNGDWRWWTGCATGGQRRSSVPTLDCSAVNSPSRIMHEPYYPLILVLTERNHACRVER
jgi:hypothetical protein